MNQDLTKTIKLNRTRSTRLSFFCFPQFKQACEDYYKTKGYNSLTDFVLHTLAERIGWGNKPF